MLKTLIHFGLISDLETKFKNITGSLGMCQLRSESGSFLRIAPLPLSRDKRIKIEEEKRNFKTVTYARQPTGVVKQLND